MTNPIPVQIFENQLPQMQATLREIVELDSPSTNKPSLDRITVVILMVGFYYFAILIQYML